MSLFNLPEDRLAGFTIGEGRTGVLTCHGFTGTPYEMREMAVYLAERGYRVTNVHLAGHNLDKHELNRTRWPDWWESLRDAYHALTAQCDRVFMCGLSMGGLLGLHLAAHYPVAGAVIMATPIFLDEPMLRWVPWLKHVVPFRTKEGSDIKNPEAAAAQPNIGATPLACVESLTHFMRHVDEDLPEVRCPMLLIYSRGDDTVPYRNMEYIAGRVASSEVATKTIDRSGHVVTVDYEKHSVFAAAFEFLQSYST